MGRGLQKLDAGDIIFMEGSEASFYYQLVSGKVKWVNIDDDGREFLQSLIEAGESFGEMPLFDDQPYAASAIACGMPLLIRLHKSTFLKMLHENQDIHFSFTRLLTQRLRFKFYIIKEIAYHDPENSISRLLQYLKSTQKKHLPGMQPGQTNPSANCRHDRIKGRNGHTHDPESA